MLILISIGATIVAIIVRQSAYRRRRIQEGKIK